MCAKVEYWTKTKHHFKGRWAADSQFFRFLAETGVSVAGKDVIECGFGSGANLAEMYYRGATVFGVDVDRRNLALFPRLYEDVNARLACGNFIDAGILDPFPVKVFDLLFALNVIYYFSDSEIFKLFSIASDILKPKGHFVVQFIEADYAPEKSGGYRRQKFDANDNPIRYLSKTLFKRCAAQCGFSLVGSKKLSETYGIDEERLRKTRCLAFERP